MDTTIKKLYNDPPFDLQFEALSDDGVALETPAGPLVVTSGLNSKAPEPADVVAKAEAVSASRVRITLTGKTGSQTFSVTDGIARAGVSIIVKKTIEVDAKLTEVSSSAPDLSSDDSSVSNPDQGPLTETPATSPLFTPPPNSPVPLVTPPVKSPEPIPEVPGA